ncbi:MAG TPA: hypothetical protein VH834_18570 [Solirubrobacteraceae bacterium]|jgi:hypothetical protein
MSPDHEDSPELERMRKLLGTTEELLSHLEISKAAPNAEKEREAKDLEQIRRTVDEALAELASYQHGVHAATRIVNALKQSTKTIVGAMSTNTDQIGAVLSNQTPTAFEADPAILAEGEFLKAQLTGVEGTEGPRPLFKDAPTTPIASGFEVLADAVDTVTDGSYTP